jgi:hypothetical protein
VDNSKKSQLISGRRIMEDFIDYNYRKIFDQIRGLNQSFQYAACAKFLDLIRPYFCQYNLPVQSKYFFRVRSHSEQNDNFYFKNISELSYRTDFFDITTFGRCNCPFESLFYCSDHPILSFLEVTNLSKAENKRSNAYHTTGVWKMKQNLILTPIFEKQSRRFTNQKLKKITNSCIEMIDQIKNYTKKEELKEFHRIVGKEFIKDFSNNQNVYFLSAAISNYLLNSPNNEKIKLDGVTYPTCVRHDAIRNIGLNYALDPCAVGFDKKIEIISAFRSRVEKRKRGYYQKELKQCQKINKLTGEIVW